jgi:hypothetical protein
MLSRLDNFFRISSELPDSIKVVFVSVGVMLNYLVRDFILITKVDIFN